MVSTVLAATSFIGRAEEIEGIGALLADPACRLLTLIGPGGIGKTRLALESAARHAALFPDGVYFVSLAPLGDDADVLNAIVEATPFSFQQNGRDPRDQFLDYLRERQGKRLLFVLDNFEHLPGSVDLVAAMLAANPDLKILATSREALNLQEEWLRVVAGLAYPQAGDDAPPESYSAVQLFIDRARRSDVDLSGQLDSVVAICRMVDGLPLAIELAAGWLLMLTPAEIAAEIGASMDILATRSRNLPERHRSIRAVFDHSWRLLPDDEREVFRKLAIFRGGFSREAAGAVAGATLPTLAGLVDKSLVRLRGMGRYEVHELLRQYGAEQLAAAGHTAAVEQAYSDYYLALLHRLEDGIKEHKQIASLDAIETDFENIRNAWQVAVRQGNFAALKGAAESLHFFTDMRGRYHDGIPLFQAAIAAIGDPDDPIRCHLQGRLARLLLLGNMRIGPGFRDEIAHCLALARARDDRAELGFLLMVAGIIAVWQTEHSGTYANATAAAHFYEAYDIYTALDDKFYMAEALGWVAGTPAQETRHDPAHELIAKALALRQIIDDRNGIAWLQMNLTEVMAVEQNYRECERYARAALEAMREIGSRKGEMQALFKLAQPVMMKGDLEEAFLLVEQLRDLADETNNLDGKVSALGVLSFLVAITVEDYQRAATLAQQSHALTLQPFFMGHDNMTVLWGGVVALAAQGDYETARQKYRQLFWRRFSDPGPATVCLSLEAQALYHEGEYGEAAELLGLAFHQPAWAGGWLHRWPLLVRLRANLIEQMGRAEYQAAWDRGCQRGVSTTIRAILGLKRPAAEQPPTEAANQSLPEPLSERELEVLALIAAGLSNRDIAERLVLTVGTVKTHTRNIYGKLNVNSRTQALAQASRLNLL